ncbi:MAG: 50S ribosomal protein L13 [Alphaproteobacteria bacterium]|nr:50S ribosomal protein L13 [Alphaproteobacteria bacterium]
MQTKSIRKEDVKRKWILIDAQDLVLGRLAVVAATILRGKNKPSYTPHVDCGDHVVIINAEKVFLTGNKLSDKIFYWHTGYAGGIKQRTMKEILTGKHPERVIEKAIERMVPRGPLGRQVLKKLRVYPGSEHPHTAQNPEILDVAGLNPKNAKRG